MTPSGTPRRPGRQALVDLSSTQHRSSFKGRLVATQGVWLGLRLDVRLGKSKGGVFAEGQVETLAGSLLHTASHWQPAFLMAWD